MKHKEQMWNYIKKEREREGENAEQKQIAKWGIAKWKLTTKWGLISLQRFQTDADKLTFFSIYKYAK